jgi:type IV secretion system protein VirB5
MSCAGTLGLYVDAIDWSRELESAADHPGASAAAPTGVVPAPQPSLPRQSDARRGRGSFPQSENHP